MIKIISLFSFVVPACHSPSRLALFVFFCLPLSSSPLSSLPFLLSPLLFASLSPSLEFLLLSVLEASFPPFSCLLVARFSCLLYLLCLVSLVLISCCCCICISTRSSFFKESCFRSQILLLSSIVSERCLLFWWLFCCLAVRSLLFSSRTSLQLFVCIHRGHDSCFSVCFHSFHQLSDWLQFDLLCAHRVSSSCHSRSFLAPLRFIFLPLCLFCGLCLRLPLSHPPPPRPRPSSSSSSSSSLRSSCFFFSSPLLSCSSSILCYALEASTGPSPLQFSSDGPASLTR